ncbi:MAG TPA: hypothetical protein PK718_05040 [Candidatus Methanofastidiosa archaeon]|nr:hypothetical protein [Candidatus Methanofastidiosa archaeon]HPR41896.1 hypothetical protein [Candidatus Methanofastidiosa archaeon]
MNELTQKQINAIDNVAFKLDQENLNELLKIVISRQPKVELRTLEGYRISKDPGELGNFYLEGVEVGKFAGLYTESPSRIILKIAARMKGQRKERIITWHLITEEME